MDNQGNEKRVEFGGTIFRKLISRQLSDVHADACKAPCNTPTRELASCLTAPSQAMASNDTANESHLMSSEEYVSDRSSLLSLQPWIFKKENFRISEERSNMNAGEMCSHDINAFMENPLTEISARYLNVCFVHGRGQKSLKGRRNRKFNLKPISTVENCLVPQLYKDDLKFEEYVFDSLPTPTVPSTRPFCITDGRRVISKSSYNPLSSSFEKGMGMPMEGPGIVLDTGDNVTRVSSFPKLRTPKRKSREASTERFDITSFQRTPKLQHSKDLLDRVRLFSMGVGIGVISTILSHRREVEKLSNMLKSSENLVQDLQDELDFKESMTVKELANGSSGDHEIVKEEQPFESNGNPVGESHFPTDTEGSNHFPKAEIMSQIEAELEAELERLELNMNESTLDGKMSVLDELDQDLAVDVVHGELRADMFVNGDCNGHVVDDSDSSDSSREPLHNSHGAVSPRELSIRLHELIQFRLEERIKELENELQHSQKQLQLSEAESFHGDRPFSSSDMGSSSNQESPNNLAPPLYLNLAGDALDAYEEAYKEFMRTATTEENAPSTTNFSNDLADSLYPPDRSLVWGMESIKYFEEEAPWEQKSKSNRTDYSDLSHNIDDDYDDEDVEGKMLIQKIVESTRKGSPAVLHAQRFLFSVDK